MSVLVTGGSGFVGLNLVEALLARGEEVVCLGAEAPPPEARLAFQDLPGKLLVAVGDVRDQALLEKIFREGGCEKVIHGAAVSAGPARERRAPHLILDVNAGATASLLEVAQRYPVRRFLYLSSAAVYGPHGFGPGPLDESGPVQPDTLYAISKYAAERTALRLKQLSGLDVVVARLGPAFGTWERENAHRDTLSAPYQCLVAALEERPAILPRPGLSDWLYARDLARALLLLLDADRPRHEVYNVGSGITWTVEDFCLRLARRHPGFEHRLSNDIQEITIDYYAPADRVPLAIDRLTAEFGWRARFNLDDAFTDLVAWLES